MTTVVSRSLTNYIITAVLSIVIAWLIFYFVYPRKDKPYIGTCENTDVGVTTSQPKEYTLSGSEMMEQNLSAGMLISGSLVLVDSFNFTTTRMIVFKNSGRCCYDYIQAVRRDDWRSVFRTYSATDRPYIVTLNNGFWRVYIRRPNVFN